MRKLAVLCCLLLLTSAFGHKAIAQDAAKAPDTAKASEPPAHYYHFEFVIQELSADGKPVNSRSYSSDASTSRFEHGTIRTGTRIPIVTAAPVATAGGEKKAESQYQYLDIGVNIDLRDIHEVGSQLALFLHTEVTSLASNVGPIGPADPVIRQNNWQATILIPIGKPTVVFKSDDLDSKGGMQVVVTAAPLL